MTAFTPHRVRAVLHMDINDEDLSRAAEVLARVMATSHVA
jgi:hypothetical protein